MHDPNLLAKKLRLRELTSLAEFIHSAMAEPILPKPLGFQGQLLMIVSMIANSPH